MRMVVRCQLEGALAELGGGARVGRDERLCGVEQRRNRNLVPGLGARRQLHRDLDRQGAVVEQHTGCLAVECTAGGDRHAGPDGLAGDVVPERQLLIALDQQVRFEQLTDRRQQV